MMLETKAQSVDWKSSTAFTSEHELVASSLLDGLQLTQLNESSALGAASKKLVASMAGSDDACMRALHTPMEEEAVAKWLVICRLHSLSCASLRIGLSGASECRVVRILTR